MTWVDFLTACVQRGLSNVKQSCAMRSPSEMDAPSEMFFLVRCDSGMFTFHQ